MAKTLPGTASIANLNGTGDDPEQALLTDCFGIGTNLNASKSALGAFALLDLGQGLELDAQGTGTNDKVRLSLGFISATSNITLGTAHRSKLVDYTGAGGTLPFTAAGTLGDGWFTGIRNSNGTANIILDPNSSEQIDGATQLTLGPGESAIVATNGNLFRSLGLRRRCAGFSARGGGNTITAGNFVKVSFSDEEFDSHGYFDPTTNYRFTPLAAGVYSVHAKIALPVNANKVVGVAIYKNGSVYKQNTIVSNGAGASTVEIEVSASLALNGSSDYIECYCFNGDSTNQNVSTDNEKTHFSAVRVSDWTS
jgi:hypothetical protein